MLLMHKNIPVAEIELISGRPYKIKGIINKSEFPVGMYSENPELQSALLLSWYKSRTIPNGRPQTDKILNALGISRTEAFLKSSGISLTDTYWFKEEDNPLLWKDVNFYDNGFEPVFAEYFLDGITHFSPSPDFTTDGVLDKFWVSSFGIPYLVKFDLKHNGLQSANEVVVSKIAGLLNIDAVQYLHTFVNGNHACICPSFIDNSNDDFISGLQLQYNLRGTNKTLFDILPPQKEKLIALDVLVGNEDRHEKNLGIINEKLSPIFDSGSCLNFNNAGNNPELKFPRMKRANIKPTFSIDDIPEQSLLDIIDEVYEDFEIEKSFNLIAKESLKCGMDIVFNEISFERED